MKKIKSYEDALKVLGKEQPSYLNEMTKHEQAYHKLTTIADALNIGVDIGDRIYMYWFYWGFLLGGGAPDGSTDGLGFVDSVIRFSGAASHIGSRFCSGDEETAEYLGSKPFIDLWRDYILGNE